jgi:large subunit ribosomal protein L21
MSYAIVSIGGKQYRVREGQHLLVDRVALDDGATFRPPVLLVGGDGDVAIAPEDVTVTARVVEQQRGPKLVIGKFKKRTGYRRRTGFRAALTKVQIESIGAGGAPSRPAKAAKTPAQTATAAVSAELPDGYADLTVAQIKDASSACELGALQSALAYEQEHAKRKGAVAALESAIAGKEGD